MALRPLVGRVVEAGGLVAGGTVVDGGTLVAVVDVLVRLLVSRAEMDGWPPPHGGSARGAAKAAAARAVLVVIGGRAVEAQRLNRSQMLTAEAVHVSEPIGAGSPRPRRRRPPARTAAR